MLPVLAGLFILSPALAQSVEDVEFAGTKEAEEGPEAPETTVSVELGGVLAAGNVDYQTAQGRGVVTHRWTDNGLGLVVTGNLGRSVVDDDGDGLLSPAERSVGYQETARRLHGVGRYDRFFGERSSVYVLAGALFDPFSGYDLRTNEQLGVSRKLVDKEKFTFVGELGLDYAQENYVDGVVPNSADILAARVFLGTVWKPSDDVSVSNELEVYENVLTPEDLRLLDTFAVSAKLSDVFSVKTSYALVFDNVPVEGFLKTDQVVMLTLVASLL